MHRYALKSLLLTSAAVLFAIPTYAQVHADIGPVHIRIANQAPPRARYEVRTARPHQDALWIGGSWDRQGDNWVWLTGRWERPQARGSRWIGARYTREGCHWYRQRDCGWRYEPAHWSHQQIVEGDDYQRWKKERRNNKRN
jgi:hypothetical protein